MPRNLSEADRKKNQFDKEERGHLLAIMKQYAPLLEKSASTLARKKIWTTIEDEFKKAGFTRKTSAQLKKYWQNYKYHCKKASAFGKENKRYVDSEMKESVQWNRYQVFVENRTTTKFSEMPDVVRSLTDHLQRSTSEPGCRSEETHQENGESSRKLNTSDAFIDLSRVKSERNADETAASDDYKSPNPLEDINLDEDSLEEKKEIFENEDLLATSSLNGTDCKSNNQNCIIVSNAKISNNSVTVSVIYPENSESKHFANDSLDRRLEIRSSSVSLPFRRSDGEEQRAHECKSKDDLPQEKEIGDFSREDREFVVMESDENDVSSARAKNFAARNDKLENRGSYVFLTDYQNRLKHRLILQQLETEEKRLKVKIAEMAIQEVQLRIKALSEDMRRTEELHQLRLTQAVAANANV